jgi:MtrB/PioB family decaheme-associated outer membrane protein
MKARTKLLLGCATGALMLLVGPASVVLAADPAGAKAEPVAPATWWTHGFVEVGGRFFLNNPSRGSLGKFYEYRDLRPGPTGDMFIAAGTSDGLYSVDFFARNIGYDDQSFLLSLAKAGEHYLDVGWDQTPHVYSQDARTLYGGIGSNTLTIPSGVRSDLNTAGATATAVGVAAANSTNIDVKIRRDTASVNYRWTPEEAWDFRVDYSHMRREGTQVGGVLTFYNNTRMALEVPKPIADTTQRGNATGEYIGTTPWGKKFNVSMGYGFSLYDNDYSAFSFQNPWRTADAGNAPLNNQYGLAPSNRAQSVSMTSGVELPFRSRYIGSFQYSLLEQSETFLPFTINSVAPGGAPSITANRLDGRTNTVLASNVLTTQITNDVKSTLRYRYYDYDNGGQPITVTNWVVADNTTSLHTSTATPVSYNKQNASADVTWRAAKWITFGVGYAWERWDRDHRDTNITDEHTGKMFIDVKPWDWTRLRASYQYSERRFDQYVNALPGVNDNSMRMFDQANRNRSKGNFYIDIFADNNFTITPTAGFRNDDYGTNPYAPDYQYGLVQDNSWNAGLEVAWAPSREFSIFVSYLREDAFRQIYNSTSATGARLNLEMHDIIDTVIVGANVVMVPDKLDVKASLTVSRSNQSWGMFNGPSASGPPYSPLATYPNATNNYDRVDVLARYILDPDLTSRMGWKAESYVKLRYMWERNDLANWQIIDPQLGWVVNSTNTTMNRSVWMQWDKPNFNVHLVALAFGVKW